MICLDNTANIAVDISVAIQLHAATNLFSPSISSCKYPKVWYVVYRNAILFQDRHLQRGTQVVSEVLSVQVENVAALPGNESIPISFRPQQVSLLIHIAC